MEEQQKKKKGKRKGLGGLSPEKKKMLKVGYQMGSNCAPFYSLFNNINLNSIGTMHVLTQMVNKISVIFLN